MNAAYATLRVCWLCRGVGAGVGRAAGLQSGAAFPPLWVIALAILASLFVWQFGVQAPRVGLISMERVPQIGLLLAFSPAVAAAICAAASLIWPIVRDRKSVV